MTPSTHQHRRLTRCATVVALLLTGAALAVLPTSPARAACPIDNPDCGGPTEHSYSSTLTVNRQSGVGTVTSSPAGIACPSDCTQTDTQTSPSTIRPKAGWTTYTLTATNGPGGGTAKWAGCDSVDAADRCIVTNSDPTTTVALGWDDITRPTVHLSSPSAGEVVGRSVVATASAADGSGISKVVFEVDNSIVATDTTAPYSTTLDLSGMADGPHFVSAIAFDNSGLTTQEHVTVTLDATAPSLDLTGMPADGGTVSGSALAVKVTSTDPHGVHLACKYDGTTTPCTSGSSLNLAVPSGSHTFSATTRDDIGNTRSTTVHFTGVAAGTSDPGGSGEPGQPADPGTPGDTGTSGNSGGTTGTGTGTTGGAGGTGVTSGTGSVSTTPTHAGSGKARTALTARAAHKTNKRHTRVRLSAKVKPARVNGGTVRFTRGKRVLCTARVRHGKATCTTGKLGRGTVHVVARYLGTRAYKASTARFTFRVR